MTATYAAIAKYLDDEEFGVDELAGAFAMSQPRRIAAGRGIAHVVLGGDPELPAGAGGPPARQCRRQRQRDRLGHRLQESAPNSAAGAKPTSVTRARRLPSPDRLGVLAFGVKRHGSAPSSEQIACMSRRRRPYLAGSAFHVTARTLDHEPWFHAALRDRVVEVLGESFARSDATLIAYVVMPNHFHIVLRQGELPLSHVMQRLCRGIALAVNRDLHREGYVFERRYRAKACRDAEYLRDVIAYVHLNPRRAGLCNSLNDYYWSSHAEYAGMPVDSAMRRNRLQLVTALELFLNKPTKDASAWNRSYLEYLAWRDDRSGRPEETYGTSLRCEHGNQYWRMHFAGLALPNNTKPDLRDIVLRVLADCSPAVDLQLLRLRRGGSRMVRVRHQAIEKAFLAGYRGVDIARFLNISETTVSKVCTRLVVSRCGRSADQPTPCDAGAKPKIAKTVRSEP